MAGICQLRIFQELLSIYHPYRYNMTDTKKPRASNSQAQQELDRAEAQLEAFEQNAKSLTLDQTRSAPREETESVTKLSQAEIEKMKEIYLKSNRSIASTEKFNEKFRDQYNYEKEYVRFIADHNEVKGDIIELWIKAFPGQPAEFWQIPTGKPVWAPRYVKDRINSCEYSRWVMEDRPTDSGGGIQYYGAMKVETLVKRLEARTVEQKKFFYNKAA